VEVEPEGGQAASFLAVVGDVQDGHGFRAMDFLKKLQKPLAGVVVEGGKRFVQKEESGPRGQCPAEGNPLAFTAGEAVGFALEERSDGEGRGEFVDPGLDFSGGTFAEFEGKCELFADGERGEESGVLGDIADVARTWGKVGDVCVVEQDASVGGVPEAAEDFEQGGFALAGGAGEDGIGALWDGEGEVVEGE
jgi:hypothetical protein